MLHCSTPQSITISGYQKKLCSSTQCRKFAENCYRPAGPATPESSRQGLKVAGPAVNLNDFIFFFLFFNLDL